MLIKFDKEAMARKVQEARAQHDMETAHKLVPSPASLAQRIRDIEKSVELLEMALGDPSWTAQLADETGGIPLIKIFPADVMGPSQAFIESGEAKLLIPPIRELIEGCQSIGLTFIRKTVLDTDLHIADIWICLRTK